MRICDDSSVGTAEFLLAALERADDAVVIVDGDHHVSHFNAAAELIWGIDRAELLGRDASCLGLPDLRQAGTVDGGTTKAPDPSAARRPEITITRKDGSRIRCAVSLSHVEGGGQI